MESVTQTTGHFSHSMNTEQLQNEMKAALLPKKSLVKRRAAGRIKHDYLVPGGPYEEHWDWDGFFIGMALAADIASEAVFLKNWCLNYLEAVGANGFTPGLLTTQGTDKRLKHIKPFLAQGCYFASAFLGDFSWIKPFWAKLKKSVAYRERIHFDKKRGLGSWHNSMESGADNNAAALDFPNGGVLATDLNSFLYREYIALEKIARKLNEPTEAKLYRSRANNLKKNIRENFWDVTDQIFYNIDRRNGALIHRVSYNSIIPLWAGIASQQEGASMIRRYLLNPNKLFAPYGVRTLAKDDPSYNQTNMIKPHSNWQGPMWPIANFFAMHALLNYGFRKEAKQVAERVTNICLRDIKKTGGMHENYNADTGEPLAAPNFISWNLLVGSMIEQAKSGTNPFRIE